MSGQESRYSYSQYWNQARIKNNLVRFAITGQESRFLTIEIPYRERINILSDLLLDGKRESRNKNQDFTREISRIKKEI